MSKEITSDIFMALDQMPSNFEAYSSSMQDSIPLPYREVGAAIVESHAYRIANNNKRRLVTAPIEKSAVEILYSLDWPLAKIGTVLGRSGTWAHNQLQANGVLRRPLGPRPIPLPENLRELHASTDDLRMTDLADQFGCSDTTIGRKIKSEGGKLKSRGGRSQRIEIPDSLIDRYLAGEKVEDLRKEVTPPVAGETLRRRAKEKGVRFKKGKGKVTFTYEDSPL
jgi:hypothetical protein